MDTQVANNNSNSNQEKSTINRKQINKYSNDNQWVSIASLAMFILLSLGVIIFLYYQNQKLKEMLASYQTKPSPSPNIISQTPNPTPTCKPRPACLDEEPKCLMPETPDMCPPTSNNSQKACTQEAKLCPDGSYVERTGPNCEFAPCPNP